MEKIPHPEMDPTEVFLKCVDGITDSELNRRLRSITETIRLNSNTYIEKAQRASLFEIPETDSVEGVVTDREMSILYERQMAHRNGSARRFYEKIKLGAVRCPYCLHQQVTTLDHYLPKAKFPVFAVNPLNLVPCCWDCNIRKSTKAATTPDKQPIHPYFNDFPQERWLKARIREEPPPVVIFFSEPPSTWSPTNKNRVGTHFRMFKLNELYGANAASELINIGSRLQKLLEQGGGGAVRAHLLEEAESRLNASLNTWQSATYVALCESEWFCNEGCTFL